MTRSKGVAPHIVHQLTPPVREPTPYLCYSDSALYYWHCLPHLASCPSLKIKYSLMCVKVKKSLAVAPSTSICVKRSLKMAIEPNLMPRSNRFKSHNCIKSRCGTLGVPTTVSKRFASAVDCNTGITKTKPASQHAAWQRLVIIGQRLCKTRLTLPSSREISFAST